MRDRLLAFLKGPPTLVLIGFLVLAMIYGIVVPPFENLDEIEHFEVVRYIADTGRLPVHGTAEAENYHYRQEASQPPLYHALSAALVQVLRLETDDSAAAWPLNPWVACGPGAASLYDNRAVLYHDPHQESFPWRGALLTLHALRLCSTLLQAITVLGTYVLARLVFPRRRHVGLAAMAIVAFNPQFLLVASGVNNDNLLTPLVTLSLCLILRTWQDGLSTGRTVGLGVLIGLAGLSKLSGWFLLPLFFIVAIVRPDRSSASSRPAWLTIDHWKPAFTHGILVVSIALALSGWWFWRNWRLYGDPTALQPMLVWVGARDGSLCQSFLELGTMFRSFWGQIPCAFYPPGFYAFYAILTLIAFSGLIVGWRRLRPTMRGAVLILATWFLLILGSWTRWNAMTAAPGGRLLFPALPAVGLLMALGIDSLMRKFAAWRAYLTIALLAFFATWTGLRILPGFFAPPARYDRTRAVRPTQAFEASIAEKIALLGYDVSVTSKDESLDLTLYWQALAPMVEDYVLTVQLVSARPGDNVLRLNYNAWPGHGTYPTSAWRPGEVIVDTYDLCLPEADFYTQAWELHVAFYEGTSGERLSIDSGEKGGAPTDHVVLTRLRIPGDLPICPADDVLQARATFGEAVALTHASIASAAESTAVHLCWEVLQPLSADYTVFVHLEDTPGTQIATGDGPPMGGSFPTSMWQPGDVIRDTHILPVALPSQGGRITVGLYNPNDGSRLPASIVEHPIPDAAVQIWPTTP